MNARTVAITTAAIKLTPMLRYSKRIAIPENWFWIHGVRKMIATIATITCSALLLYLQPMTSPMEVAPDSCPIRQMAGS